MNVAKRQQTIYELNRFHAFFVEKKNIKRERKQKENWIDHIVTAGFCFVLNQIDFFLFRDKMDLFSIKIISNNARYKNKMRIRIKTARSAIIDNATVGKTTYYLYTHITNLIICMADDIFLCVCAINECDFVEILFM